MNLIKKFSAAFIAAIALGANAQTQTSTCTTATATVTATTTTVTPKGCDQADKKATPAPSAVRRPAQPPADTNAATVKALADENLRLKAALAAGPVRTTVEPIAPPAVALAPVTVTGIRPVEIIAPESGAVPKERDFNVTVHTKKVRCLFRENGEITVRTYRDTVQLCHDWANSTSLSLGLVDTAINFDKLTGDVIGSANSPAPTATKVASAQPAAQDYTTPKEKPSDGKSEGEIPCDLTYNGKVVLSTRQPSIPACKAWTLEEATKRGWIPAGKS